MTTASMAHVADPSKARPSRRVLVGLATVILVMFVVLIATSNDISADTSAEKIKNAYDMSETASRISAYAGMVFVALLLFFGSALRNALGSSSKSWFADPAFLGFSALAATFASWVVTDAAMWRAVDGGYDGSVRTIAIFSDVGFLPLMASIIAIYVGTGLAGLTTGALPKWLAIASIVVGAIAPLGPLGFVGFMLLPLWIVAVASWVRIDQ